MADIEFVRVKDPGTGAEFTYDTAKVEALGLQDHVIDKAPLGVDGLPAPAKPNLPLGEALPGSAADRRRETAKTTAKRSSKRAAKKATAAPAADDQTPGAPDPGQEAGQTSADPEKEH